METGDIISIIKDVFLALSAFAVALFALVGLKTWRKELTGKAKFETARNMMRIALELKANFGMVRHPITYGNEYAGRTTQSGESERESHNLNEWYAKNNRFKSVVESLNRIIEVQWETKILLDEDNAQSIKEAAQSFRESYADLSTAISEYFEAILDEIRTGERFRDQEWLRGLKKIVYSAQDDDFSRKVDDATNKLSSALKRYVK